MNMQTRLHAKIHTTAEDCHELTVFCFSIACATYVDFVMSISNPDVEQFFEHWSIASIDVRRHERITI